MDCNRLKGLGRYRKVRLKLEVPGSSGAKVPTGCNLGLGASFVCGSWQKSISES
jgi:hypothetical protein